MKREHISAELFKQISDAYFALPITANSMTWSMFRASIGLIWYDKDPTMIMHEQLSIADKNKFLLAKIKYGF